MNNQQSHDPISHHPTETTHPPQSEMFQDGHDYAYQPSSGNPIQESTVPVWKPFHQSPARGTPSYYGLSPHNAFHRIRRPAKANSAASLGNLDGFLGLARSAFAMLYTTAAFLFSTGARTRLPSPTSLPDLIFLIFFGTSIFSFGIAVTLLVGSSKIGKDKGRTTLLVAGFMQVVVVLFETVLFICIAINVHPPIQMLMIVFTIQSFGLILAIRIIVFLLNREVTMWQRALR